MSETGSKLSYGQTMYGKGSKDTRISDREQYHRNLDAIDWEKGLFVTPRPDWLEIGVEVEVGMLGYKSGIVVAIGDHSVTVKAGGDKFNIPFKKLIKAGE